MQKILFLKGLFLFGLGFFWPSIECQKIPPLKSIKGSGIFEIKEKRKKEYFGSPTFFYKGKLLFFTSEDQKIKNLDCSLSTKKESFSSLSSLTLLDHILLSSDGEKCVIKIGKESSCSPLNSGFSLPLLRAKLKEQTTSILKKHYEEDYILKTLTALTTAELDHKLLRFHFARAGLLHLLALSGFHFVFISSLLTFLFSWALNKKALNCLLIVLLTFFTIYLGGLPSIIRAYITILIYLIGKLFGKTVSSMNCLGVSAFFTFLISPTLLKTSGFQLSYLATFSILYIYPILQKNFRVENFSCRLSPILYKGLLLNSGVCFFTLPLVLFHFQTFPFISLILNLFVPACFSIILFLLCLGLILEPLEGLAHFIHKTNEWFTSLVLNWIFQTPPFLCFDITCTFLTPISSLILLTFFWIAFALCFKLEKNGNALRNP